MDSADRCLFLIPARLGSKRIPGKNFLPLAGISPTIRAIQCAQVLSKHNVMLTTDNHDIRVAAPAWIGVNIIWRSGTLVNDICPMVDVVKDALQGWPGGDPVVLLQPTQPLRRPETVRKAINLLTEEVDSVVTIGLDRFVRDGTAYVFWRKTVEQFGTIYGERVVLMPVPADETCPLDTPEDWAEAERRLSALR